MSLHRAFHIMIEMFHTRGRHSFAGWLAQQTLDEQRSNKYVFDNICVILTPEDTLPSGEIRQLVAELPKSVDTITLCTRMRMKLPKRADLLKLTWPIPRIEHFTHAELQFNVTKHVLVPPHTLIPKVRDADLLPLILNTDPVVRFLGGQVGQVVHVLNPPGIETYRQITSENNVIVEDDLIEGIL